MNRDMLPICELVAKRASRAAFGLITKAGHMMNVEQPDVFNRAVLAFLSSIDTP
jgi:pimeloyl-ACP methyl ester carboxylesterase